MKPGKFNKLANSRDTISEKNRMRGIPVLEGSGKITNIARWKWLPILATFMLAGCVPQAVIQPSQGHIQQSSQPAARQADIPPLVRTVPYLPSPKTEVREPTYTIVVDNVAVKDLLFSLARDTKKNIDIGTGISGNVTLNAVNEPLSAILERIARQTNIRYRMDGNTLSIMPDTPYLKTYKVNYVNLSRNATSSIGVAAQIASTGSGAVGTAASGSTQGGNSSSTTVDSQSNNNFWDVLTENLRAILTSTRASTQRAEDKAARLDAERNARADRLEQAQAVARAGASATTLYKEVFNNTSSSLLNDSKNDVIVNPVAGTVSILGNERQQQVVKQYLDRVGQSSQRQVLIEATIVEVNLNDQYHAGIDWSQMANAGNGLFVTTPASPNNLAGALQPFINIGYRGPNITGAINLLESFGNVRVLSSPKLMALNNQTALLKVVDNLVYFNVQAQQGTLSSTGTPLQPTTFTTTAKTVPVGLVMSLTPQISENGMVTLDVRPTISRKISDVSDPNPGLPAATPNKIPVIQVREMESVLQIRSGQTVILGGLMQDDSDRARDGIPVLSRPEGIGALFGQQERNIRQTELVIFLRPTVITNPSLDSDELKFYKRYLPSANATPGQWHNGADAAGDPQ
ncbi:type II secretion pathway protein D homolog [Sulfuriferula multivorans]|uniref:Type II secretion pathway protein D homolog n=1 Tax=Sulfuriferula multivorans TaxID=1559896 RepID=A0A401JCY1_9PROT|nr:secretin and TonB N-terminal domain-containing protein [Sulfuriferula multivorans]GBL45444.1 type II secretion pathway protein D homolog [Sulfuriferula multivorans]